MDKRQYFIEAIQEGAFIHKAWVISIFTVLHPTSTLGKIQHPYQLVRNPEDAEHVYFQTQDGGLDIIDGATWTSPIFTYADRITLNPNDIANVVEVTETTYGNALYNAMVLVYAFGKKMPFKTGSIKGSKVENEISAKLKDTPADGEERSDKFFYVDELLRYCEATSALAGFTQIQCPSGTARSMVPSPAIVKRRDELLKQYKDQLRDPAIIAKIEDELIEMDKAYIKGDRSEKFYLKEKMYAVNRKRCFAMFGAEVGFGNADNGVNLIVPSLTEGWDVNELPTMTETLRAGSYNRGHETALGGESVKYFYRIFQNTRIAEPDCGTMQGLTWTVSDANYKTFNGLHLAGFKANPTDLVAQAEATRLTEDKLKALIGKPIVTRSPMYCKTKAPSFCAICVGDQLAGNPNGLHIAVSDVGSRFLYVFMAAMHGKALRTAEYRIETAFT